MAAGQECCRAQAVAAAGGEGRVLLVDTAARGKRPGLLVDALAGMEKRGLSTVSVAVPILIKSASYSLRSWRISSSCLLVSSSTSFSNLAFLSVLFIWVSILCRSSRRFCSRRLVDETLFEDHLASTVSYLAQSCRVGCTPSWSRVLFRKGLLPVPRKTPSNMFGVISSLLRLAFFILSFMASTKPHSLWSKYPVG